MSAPVAEWAQRGRFLVAAGRRIFVWERGSGRALLALHGFPASSYDWRLLAEGLLERRFVAFDFPGFGLSDKAASGDYSLLALADVVEDLARQLRIESCDLVAHDMGDSVAAELLARQNAGVLGFAVERTVLLNGSIFIELAQLTRGQKLFLRLPARKLPLPVPVRLFRSQMQALFSSQHPVSDEELSMLEAFLAHDGGARLVPVTIRYIEERHKRAERWTAGLVDFTGTLAVIWGELDPVAVPAMVDRLLKLRPATEAVRWDDVGHWPQLEVPARVAVELKRLLP